MGEQNNSEAISSIEIPAANLEEAMNSFAIAQKKQSDVLASVVVSENRMKELQQQAEECHLAVVEAEAELEMASEKLHELEKEAEKSRRVYLEALDVLNEAQKLVSETEGKYRLAEELRCAKEQEVAPFNIKLGLAQTTYARFIALAEVEKTKLKRHIASAEEEVSVSRVAICDARLQVLQAPEALAYWPAIKELMWEGN